MEVRVKVRRAHTVSEYRVEAQESSTVLDLLNFIKENMDPTLSYRSMCRAGVCGTCAVMVNSKPILACSTKALELGRELLIEPLQGFEVIRDLVVDHARLVERIRGIRLEPTSKNREVFPQELVKMERSWECILCGACDAVCPVLSESPSFGGPMAFIRAYKHIHDPRNSQPRTILALIKDRYINLCTHCRNCSLTCPRLLYPELAIAQEESILISEGLLEKPTQTDFGFLGF